MRLKAHTMMTNSRRTYRAFTRNAEGEVKDIEVTEQVSINDIHTPADPSDARVFWRGARVA